MKSSFAFCLFCLLVFTTAVDALTITGRIDTCSGWHLNKLPDLRSFVRVEAENYQNVFVNFVRGKTTILKIFHDGVEADSYVLSALPTKERMHQVMRSFGFVLKSPEELARDREIKERQRYQRSLAMFHRKEYVRKQNLHCHLFRQQVMQDITYKNISWVYKDKDILHENYDKIFRKEAVFNNDLLEYSKRYLEAAAKA